uniref:Protein kinase domain-containing protein n=1 Tax=Macrostomum lignano TaxID=282301 RepID=A0A1I8FPE2_9PLAT
MAIGIQATFVAKSACSSHYFIRTRSAFPSAGPSPSSVLGSRMYRLDETHSSRCSCSSGSHSTSSVREVTVDWRSWLTRLRTSSWVCCPPDGEGSSSRQARPDFASLLGSNCWMIFEAKFSSASSGKTTDRKRRNLVEAGVLKPEQVRILTSSVCIILVGADFNKLSSCSPFQTTDFDQFQQSQSRSVDQQCRRLAGVLVDTAGMNQFSDRLACLGINRAPRRTQSHGHVRAGRWANSRLAGAADRAGPNRNLRAQLTNRRNTPGDRALRAGAQGQRPASAAQPRQAQQVQADCPGRQAGGTAGIDLAHAAKDRPFKQHLASSFSRVSCFQGSMACPGECVCTAANQAVLCSGVTNQFNDYAATSLPAWTVRLYLLCLPRLSSGGRPLPLGPALSALSPGVFRRLVELRRDFDSVLPDRRPASRPVCPPAGSDVRDSDARHCWSTLPRLRLLKLIEVGLNGEQLDNLLKSAPTRMMQTLEVINDPLPAPVRLSGATLSAFSLTSLSLQQQRNHGFRFPTLVGAGRGHTVLQSAPLGRIELETSSIQPNRRVTLLRLEHSGLNEIPSFLCPWFSRTGELNLASNIIQQLEPSRLAKSESVGGGSISVATRFRL